MGLAAINNHSPGFGQGTEITNCHAGGGVKVLFLELKCDNGQVTFLL